MRGGRVTGTCPGGSGTGSFTFTLRGPCPLLGLCAAVLFVAACGTPASDLPLDSGIVDAGVTAQPVDIRILSWNLGNFVGDGGEPQRVGSLARTAAPAIIVAQELADDAALSALVAEFPGFSGVLATATSTSPDQRVALMWDPARVQITGITNLFETSADFPRPVLRGEVSVSSSSFRLYAVHLKAGLSSEQTRINASQTIKADATSSNVLVIGDFNEALSDPRSSEVFGVWKPEYNVASLPLADAGTVTFLPANIMLDHVALKGLQLAKDGGVSVARFDQQTTNYAQTVSDHLPLVVDLEFAR